MLLWVVRPEGIMIDAWKPRAWSLADAELCENHTRVNFFVPFFIALLSHFTLCENHQIPELTRKIAIFTSRHLAALVLSSMTTFIITLKYYFQPLRHQNIECVNRNSPHSQTPRCDLRSS